MKKSKSHPEPSIDQRLLLLFMGGLLIAAGHAIPRFYSSQCTLPVDTFQKMEVSVPVWLSGPSLSDGLYQVGSSLTLAQLADSFGSSVPADWPAGELPLDPLASVTFAAGSLPRIGKAPSRVAPLFFTPMPINRADRQSLTIVPGIGPVLAERIIQERNRIGGFRNQDQLYDVTGLGNEKIKTLRKYVSID